MSQKSKPLFWDTMWKRNVYCVVSIAFWRLTSTRCGSVCWSVIGHVFRWCRPLANVFELQYLTSGGRFPCCAAHCKFSHERRRSSKPKLHQEYKKIGSVTSVHRGYLSHYRTSMKNCFPRKISLKSGSRLLSYGQKTTFKKADVRHLEF